MEINTIYTHQSRVKSRIARRITDHGVNMDQNGNKHHLYPPITCEIAHSAYGHAWNYRVWCQHVDQNGTIYTH